LQTTGRPYGDPEPVHEGSAEAGAATSQRWRLAVLMGDRVLHGVGRSAFYVAPVAFLAMLIIGLGYVRLSHGPLSLKFLVGPIEKGINAELDGDTVKIDDVVVAFSGKGGIEFRLRNLRMREPDGDIVASAPQAAVELSSAALWSARIVPARVELIEPRLFLFYSDGGGLSLSFSKPIEGEESLVVPAPKRVYPPGAEPKPKRKAQPPAGPLKRIDLARAVTDMSARARKRLGASSYLKEFGLRNATVVLEYSGKSTEWRVPVLLVEIMHARNRSVIAGRATIASGAKPWELTFQTDESEAAHTLNLKTSIKNLVPRSLAPAVPQLSLLQAFDMPIGGSATLKLSTEGDIRAATLDLNIGRGSLRLPALPEAPLEVDGGSLNLAYDGRAQKVVLSPSTLRWRGSRITLAGTLENQHDDPVHPAWAYRLSASEGVFAANEFGVVPVKLDAWRANGRIIPSRGEIELADFNLKAGGAEIILKADMVAGVDPASTRLEGSFSPMPLATLKALWPKAVAPGAREWIGENMLRADVLGAKFQFSSGANAFAQGFDAQGGQHRLTFSLEAANIEMEVIDNMPRVFAPRALVRIDDDVLEVKIPDAAIILASNRFVPLKSGAFTATKIMSDVPMGEVDFTSPTSLALVLEILERAPPSVMDATGLPHNGIAGKFDGQFKVTLPLLADVSASAIKISGKAKISDGSATGLIEAYRIQGASIDLDFTEKAVDASGEMLVNGVLAKLSWQRIFDAPADKQPPLRITATLDNNDRTQLGLDVNHILQGEVPVEITITRDERQEPAVRLRADLSAADLVLQNVSWRKPPGRSATLQCDIVQGSDNRMELQNFKVAGDDVAIEGWAAIGADNRLREFSFPDFSLNVVTRMQVEGTLGPDNVWKVKARGPTFDGREFFRSLFSLGQLADDHPKPEKPRDGIDLEAEIGTVIGFSEVSLRGVKLKLTKRGEKLIALDAQGTLDGGKPLAVVLREETGKPRKLLADSTDAGQAFKLIDFYPNIQGGRVLLEVNLDGRGAAKKTGILWVEKFRILGDPVVSEVFNGVDEGSPGHPGTRKVERKVVRQVFDFDRMRVPFSVGYGQFVMEESYLRGPLLGASIRGKIDFKTRRMSLGGTYIPLQGLNAALCEIPLVGVLITGPKCEGVWGMTFAIQGRMERPEVIVNPLSMLTPGILREITQMTNPNPKIQRREELPSGSAGGDLHTRASPPKSKNEPTTVGSDTIDGWNSQTIEGPVRKN
jgi:hypothetical protein